MSARTLFRLAVAGGVADRTRVILTVIGAMLATVGVLATATVIAIGPANGPYALPLLAQPGLHQGAIIALLVLCIPVVLFMGQCARVGAPARDRRLAALRLAGATPADVLRVAVVETAIAAAAGALTGFLVFRLLHARAVDANTAPSANVERPDLLWPTDVRLAWVVIGLILLAVPIVAGFSAALMLRRVSVTPFGVVRRTQTRPPRLAPILLFAVGTGGLALFTTIDSGFDLAVPFSVAAPLGLALLLASVAGLLWGTAALSHALGSFLAPRVRHPALLIASRRMVDTPYTASRTSTAVLLAVLIGAAIYGVREALFADASIRDDPLFTTPFRLLDACLAIGIAVASAGLLVVAGESIVARRRSLAALVATGTPRRTLAAAILLETLLPLTLGAVVAAAAGLMSARGVYGTAAVSTSGNEVASIPVPWGDVTFLTIGTIVVAAGVTALSLVFLRSSTNVAELRAAA